jgi:hypothetical protein
VPRSRRASRAGGSIATTVAFVLDPVGPLPASVYWRRRALALAVVIVVLLLGWAVLPGGGNDEPRDAAGAAGSASPTVPAAAPTELTASPPSDDPGRPGDGDAVDAGGATATTSAPAPTTPKPPPPAPKACADAALQVTVAPRHPAYSVGQSPILDLRVRNVSALACTRDLGAGQQEIVLFRGTLRLWSSNDCFPDSTRSVQLLRPGAVQTSSVTWSGLVSRPKCAGTRTRVGPGTYALVARLGTIVSRRSPIVLR